VYTSLITSERQDHSEASRRVVQKQPGTYISSTGTYRAGGDNHAVVGLTNTQSGFWFLEKLGDSQAAILSDAKRQKRLSPIIADPMFTRLDV
jgi:hypothetical protein